jgi:carbamoyltransferase
VIVKFKKNKIKLVPGVVHIDGTGRLQTVKLEDNKRYYNLIKNFKLITGIPIILNTSLNENEPVVRLPKEAIACFLRTDMDVLVHMADTSHGWHHRLLPRFGYSVRF